MDSRKMRKIFEERLAKPGRKFIYDRDKEDLRIEHEASGKGITVSIGGIVAKWHERKEAAIEEAIYYIEEGLEAMAGERPIEGEMKKVFPIIRSASFPTEPEEGNPFLFDEHTAETRIYYAYDMGNTYRLIDKRLLQKEGWDPGQIREVAMFNVRSLPIPLKEDKVAGNIFYFINTNDGYDASRILNKGFLVEMQTKIAGTMALAVPHQDVLIIADIRNDTGYDVLAQMAMGFFAAGKTPVTALSFLFENGELEPIFILGKNRSQK
ncbi:hypothetical protein A8F94_06050 [Bacillus sp. FJAT-27225]|uniref:DUF1444 domain-containing protein n=1 Tax=Bacillus sp. FJAT-27225 TaxID=1743144 RepID=UPI00080C3353|nr:DUF1444 domain-containing protein [Bacillus sp. FJAT-27225]OCA91576.1 hypothetical protein A8F94_06050 [Bacillus sp. FJAT-27225]